MVQKDQRVWPAFQKHIENQSIAIPGNDFHGQTWPIKFLFKVMGGHI